MYKNLFHSSLRANYSSIVRAIQSDVITIANQAYSKGLISEGLHDKILTSKIPDTERASVLLSAVQHRVKLHPKSYSIFMGILKEEPSYSPLVKQIEGFVKKWRPPHQNSWKQNANGRRFRRVCQCKLAGNCKFKLSKQNATRDTLTQFRQVCLAGQVGCERSMHSDHLRPTKITVIYSIHYMGLFCLLFFCAIIIRSAA